MNHQECGRWSEGFSSGKKWGSQCKPRECIESEEMGDFCDLQRSGGLKQESVTFDSLWGVTKGKGGIPGAQGDSRSADFEKGGDGS